ncbi:PREDICTED: Werner Syndrome-like exonuclease [Nicrophorus vespilloides]|uniref:3'-5' exonuclease n=1 Tax=Nicrophorus vespilloides TaxID=110193 RepID=A0ABM1M7D9_NICVS|nr:PREDICTED: Werner Syndrome-like exonuclease [Nicrophorus vespilloides]
MESTRMRTRSQVPLAEKNTESKEVALRRNKRKALETAPFVKFDGIIKYYTTFIDCAEISEKLLNGAKSSIEEISVGFDLEWPFNFTTGPGKTAVIQISPNLDITYIFHVSKITKLPQSLVEFLKHPKIRLVGNNIKNDVSKLKRDFNLDLNYDNVTDLGTFARKLHSISGRWSLQKLVEHFLELRLDKNKAVRNSKWHIIPLTDVQQKYAAIDSYVSLKLYLLLKKLNDELPKDEDIN